MTPQAQPTSAADVPFVQVATFCENVLTDQASERLSLIGIIDNAKLVTTGPEAPAQMPPFPFKAMLVLCLWMTEEQAKRPMSLRPTDPDGEVRQVLDLPYETGIAGVNLVIQFAIAFDKAGRWLFDVLMEDDGTQRLVTQVPLQVEYEARAGQG